MYVGGQHLIVRWCHASNLDLATWCDACGFWLSKAKCGSSFSVDVSCLVHKPFVLARTGHLTCSPCNEASVHSKMHTVQSRAALNTCWVLRRSQMCHPKGQHERLAAAKPERAFWALHQLSSRYPSAHLSFCFHRLCRLWLLWASFPSQQTLGKKRCFL